MKKARAAVATAAVVLLAMVVVTAGPAGATNCRQVARDVQSKGEDQVSSLYSMSETERSSAAGVQAGLAVLQKFKKAFTDAWTDYPECEGELQELWTWNQGNTGKPFPFGKSGDPKHHVLGPIGWWWDTLYNGLFGGSALLMFLFGWELFLMPFPIVFALGAGLVEAIAQLIRRLFKRSGEN